MMRLSTLWRLDSTIDPETGRSPVADGVAAAWRHDPGSVRFFRSSANFIYRLTIDGQPAYLRMASGAERTVTTIQRELDLLAWLSAEGLQVVRPIPALSGDLVITAGTSTGPMHGVVFEGLRGDIRDLGDLDLAGIERWGATVGHLHATMQRAPADLRRPAGWASALAWLARKPAGVPDSVVREGMRQREFLAAQLRTPDRYGLLHTDLELDNLVWFGDEVAVLDFDEFGEGWFLLDIAKALTDVLSEGDGLDSPRVRAFVDGYRQYQPLSDDDVLLIPAFLGIAELRMYCVLARAVDMAPEDAPVDWLRDLIVRLRGWMAQYEDELPS